MKEGSWLRERKRVGSFMQMIVLILFSVLKIVSLSKNYEINSVRFLKLFSM